MHAQAMEIEEELAIKQTVSEGVWVSIWLLTVTCHRRLQQNTCLNLVLIAVHLNILKPCKTFVSHGNDETPRLQGQPFAGAEFWAGPKATRFWWEPSQRNVRVKTVPHRVSTATSLWALVWADWLFLADSWASSWLHRLHERSRLRGQSIQTIRLDSRFSEKWSLDSEFCDYHYTLYARYAISESASELATNAGKAHLICMTRSDTVEQPQAEQLQMLWSKTWAYWRVSSVHRMEECQWKVDDMFWSLDICRLATKVGIHLWGQRCNLNGR